MIDRKRFEEGIALFNAADFFAAHEALEDVWREMQGPERQVMQGLVQVAVALHHHSTSNPEGARSVLARAAANVADAPDDFFGISMPPLRDALARWQQALAERSAPPPLPRLRTRERC